jgi:hypothetical protein
MQQVCDILEALADQGIIANYALGGATAVGFYGEPLATRDIDVFVFLDPPPGSLLVSLEPLLKHLSGLGFDEFEEEGLLVHGFPVQFLTARPGLESEALEKAQRIEWEGHAVRVMTPEHLAAIALTVGRPKDRARVVHLVSLPNFDQTNFEEIVSRHQLTPTWLNWSKALGLDGE